MKLKTYHALLFFLCGIICFVDIASTQSLTTATKSQAPQLKKYILTFPPSSPSSSFCKKLMSNLEGLQAKDITMYEEVGMAIVSCSDPEFQSKAATLQGLSSVIQDRVIQRPKQPLPQHSTESIREEDYKDTRNSGDTSDPFVELQWGLDAIHAREVHKAGYKGKNVRVAVIDGGFDLDHPDTRANIDFQASQSFVVPHEPLQYIPPSDGSQPFAHGTFVASVIAAAENGVGIVGVAPKATLILMKVFSDITDQAEWSWIASACIRAVEVGADVINLSLSGTGEADDPELAELLALFTQVFTYAHKKGVVIVASAGNDNLNFDVDPFAVIPLIVPYVIGVSATGPIGWLEDPLRRSLDNIASYSNIGKPEIDFAAPGGDFISPNTTLVTYGGLTRPLRVFDLIIGANYDNTWAFADGTSFAAPHVSGLAALIIGKYHGRITPHEVKQIMRESADDLGELGRDASYGYGRVNAYNALIGCDSYKN